MSSPKCAVLNRHAQKPVQGGKIGGTMADPTHIADLTPDPSNRRDHNPRNIGMISDALHDVGAARSIVIDEHGVIHAGNGVVEAAAQAGITKVQVVDADGETLVAVRRKGLSPEQWRKLALYDNRTAELAEWDIDQLKIDLAAGHDLTPFFSSKELDKLLGNDEEDHTVAPITIERPTELVWVLMAIPVSKWSRHNDAIEEIAADAEFSASVIRPREDKPDARDDR